MMRFDGSNFIKHKPLISEDGGTAHTYIYAHTTDPFVDTFRIVTTELKLMTKSPFMIQRFLAGG